MSRICSARTSAAGGANPDCAPVMHSTGPRMDLFCADNTYTERLKDLPRLWRDLCEQYIGSLVALRRNNIPSAAYVIPNSGISSCAQYLQQQFTSPASWNYRVRLDSKNKTLSMDGQQRLLARLARQLRCCLHPEQLPDQRCSGVNLSHAKP